MPAARPALTRQEAHRLAAQRGFDPPVPRPDDDRCRVGVELEFITAGLDDTGPLPALETLTGAIATAGALPCGSRVTFEPGGQVEISSPPLPLSSACSALERDVAAIGVALAEAGVGMVGIGLEPDPRRERVVHNARYDAMEAYFDQIGPEGRTMMRSTAAIQVNLDLGVGEEAERRWRTAHDVAPVLAAAFANSPLGHSGPTGYRSSRLAVWNAIDPARTTPVHHQDGNGTARSGRDTWADYAMSAPVMLVRTAGDRAEPVLTRLAFGEWVQRGHELGWPTVDDLDYHLTTLFPPVRPRGWLELRMLDALPAPWWHAAVAVTATLVHDDRLAEQITRATARTREMWRESARDGLSHPALRNAASACFALALDALPEMGADFETIDVVGAFIERYVARGVTPADERLRQWHDRGWTLPAPDNAVLVATGAPWA